MYKKYSLIIGIFLLTASTSFAVGVTFKDEATFADWYKDAVKHMQENGVVTGYEDGRFLPNNPVTRGELALILERYEENIVKKHIAQLGHESGDYFSEQFESHVKEYDNEYFDNHIQEVIESTLKYADEDLHTFYKSAIIMAESGIKKRHLAS